MNCDEIEELAGAYALQALPPQTLRQVEEHLEGCSRHPEIAELRSVAASLAWAPEERAPPPELKTRLMDAIRDEAAAASPAAETAPEERPGLLRRLLAAPRTPYVAVGALAILVAALIGWNIALQVSDEGGAPAGVSVHALTDGGEANGRILYIAEENVVVMTVSGLDPLPEEMTYQVWAVSGQAATGIGTFNTSGSGEAATFMDVDLTGANAVAITVEPAGGSPQPTSDPVLQAEI